MIIVPEKACPELMTLDAAVEAVEAVFGAMARGDACAREVYWCIGEACWCS